MKISVSFPLTPFLLLGILFQTACTSLQPVNKPEEYALAPAYGPLWQELQGTRPGNWFYLLNTGPEALEWRLRAIDSATSSIDLQTFLWSHDHSGLLILRHLFEAADRGVRVRILLDDTFITTHADIVWDIAHHEHIEFRVYNPFSRRSESLAMRQLLNLGEFSRVDHRMHNKALIIDNEAAIVGGRNIADEYFGRRDGDNFRDLDLIVGGPLVPDLSRLFDEFWNNPWSFPVKALYSEQPEGMDPVTFEAWLLDNVPRGLHETAEERRALWLHAATQGVEATAMLLADEPARSNPALHEELPDQLAAALRNLMDQAEEEIIIVTAYLIPTPELEAVVERAEARGVEVKILTNSLQSNNHTAAHSAYRHHIRTLIGHGADVHEVRSAAKDRGVYLFDPVEEKQLGLHAKIILIDHHLAFVGSANLDPRSLRLNTEMGLFIDSREFNARVREAIGLDFRLRNAWHLRQREDGSLVWVSDDEILETQPADSAFQRLEDWFLGILPIEGKM